MQHQVDFSALHDNARVRHFAPVSAKNFPSGAVPWAPAISTRDAVRFEIARTPEQLRQADSLVERQYRFAGFQLSGTDVPGERGLTLLATLAGTAVATVTLRVDSSAGLLADTHYNGELEALRVDGARLCEFGRFAASTEVSVLDLVGKMIRLAWRLCREEYGVSDVVVECHPRHAAFYRRVLGFRIAGAETTCARVGAPAVLLHLRLDDIAVDARLAPHVGDGHPSVIASRSGRHAVR